MGVAAFAFLAVLVSAHRPGARRGGLAAIGSSLFGLGFFSVLTGCSFNLNEGIGPYIVDPARYSAYHCRDLINRSKVLVDREKELRNLMDKASEGGGGAVIGALSYRADYEKVLGEESLLRRTAVEKKCELTPPPLQSDQIIH